VDSVIDCCMSKAALSRLKKEFYKIQKEPVENIEAAPKESNLLEWHYVVTGPKDSAYEGGKYHGVLEFPSEYPYKPPSIKMTTPNGRFQTNTKLCLSMSDFHPETWNPLWSVSSILAGLLSFMLENSPTSGSINCSDDVRRKCARESVAFNIKDPIFNLLFPHYKQNYLLNKEKDKERKEKEKEKEKEKKDKETVNSTTTNATAPNDNDKKNINNHKTQTAKGKNLRRDELWDRFIVAIILATLVFAISYLYT